MNNRELVNFMGDKNSREKVEQASHNVELYNIRLESSGLFFDIKTGSHEEFKNLHIPTKYFINKSVNQQSIEEKQNRTSKNVLISSFANIILMVFAIISVAYMMAMLFKYIPNLQNLLNFDFLY